MGYDASEGFYADAIRRQGLQSLVAISPPIPYEQVPAATVAHDVALALVPERPADWMYHPTLKILEYRALGLPIIATDFAPNREFVTEGVNGLLVQNTADSIAAAMLRFLCDPGFLAHSRAAAQTMRQGLTWDAVATQYLTLYERLLGRRAATAADYPERGRRAAGQGDIS
jgi:glycosyltransferase involved in cell wall biosynthesis